jgi:hypothetical protein
LLGEVLCTAMNFQCGVTLKLYKRKNKLYEKAIIFQVGSSTWLKIFSAFSEKRQDAQSLFQSTT